MDSILTGYRSSATSYLNRLTPTPATGMDTASMSSNGFAVQRSTLLGLQVRSSPRYIYILPDSCRLWISFRRPQGRHQRARARLQRHLHHRTRIPRHDYTPGVVPCSAPLREYSSHIVPHAFLFLCGFCFRFWFFVPPFIYGPHTLIICALFSRVRALDQRVLFIRVYSYFLLSFLNPVCCSMHGVCYGLGWPTSRGCLHAILPLCVSDTFPVVYAPVGCYYHADTYCRRDRLSGTVRMLLCVMRRDA